MNEDLLYQIGLNAQSFEKGMASVISTLKSGALAFIGFGSAGAALKFVTDKAMETQSAFAILTNTIKNSKGGSDEMVSTIKNLSEKYGILTGEGTIKAANAFNILTLKTGDSRVALASMTAAMGLSKSAHMSLEAAANVVARAYENGGSALTRFLPNLSKVGNGMEAVRAIQEETKGSIAAWSETTEGKVAVAKASIDAFATTIGNNLIPVLGHAAEAVTNFLQSFNSTDAAVTAVKKAIIEETAEISKGEKTLKLWADKHKEGTDYYTALTKKIADLRVELANEKHDLDMLNSGTGKTGKAPEHPDKTGAKVDLEQWQENHDKKAELLKADIDAREAALDTQNKLIEENNKREVKAEEEVGRAIKTLSRSKNKELFEIGKAAGMGQIVISTAEAIMNALAHVPFPVNIPAAAVIGAAGATELAAASGAAFNPAGAAEGIWDWRARGNSESLVTTLNHNEAIITKPQARNMGGTVNNYNFPMAVPSASEIDKIMREVIIPSQNRINVAKGQS